MANTRKVPLWKLAREVKRLVKQLFGTPIEVVRRVYFRRWYDRVESKKIRQTTGAVPFDAEACVYLIFPSYGVQKSHLAAIAEMRQAGISPVVVSNLSLSDEDRQTLAAEASLVIERPNIGYDFGGYRDGVLHIQDRFKDFDRLWLMNDSCWLLPQPTSWFEQARALGVDFVGATCFNFMKRADPTEYKFIEWQVDRRRKNFYYASYALSFSSNILKSPGFVKYWSGLDIRNDKGLTVRRGELGVSQWVIQRKFSHACTLELDDLAQELATLSDAQLDDILPNIITLENRELLDLKKRVLSSDAVPPTGREDKIALILAAAARCGAVYGIPAYSIPYRQFHFLKKLPLTLNEDGRASTLAIADKIDGEMGEIIRQEAALKTLKSN